MVYGRRSRLIGDRQVRVSFEFFPPKNAAMEANLWSAIERLSPLAPKFFSVTYGAGGSTRERTHATVARIVRETTVPPAAHLTCVGATREEVDEVIRAYWEAGVRHIVALRGDPPEGVGTRYAPHPGGYANAAELTAAVKRIAPFEVTVGGYPEVHPDSANQADCIDNLKSKIDAGADRVITQFFFENSDYFRFVERCRAAGIFSPIIPGVVPIHSFKQIRSFAGKTGASIPAWLAHRFEGLDDDRTTSQLVAAAVAGEQILDLVDAGVSDFHFYTLNRSDLVFAICHLIGIRPVPSAQLAGSAVA